MDRLNSEAAECNKSFTATPQYGILRRNYFIVMVSVTAIIIFYDVLSFKKIGQFFRHSNLLYTDFPIRANNALIVKAYIQPKFDNSNL